MSNDSGGRLPAAALDRALLPGQEVGGYTILGPLGIGTFGTVYRARHPLIEKLAAVKVLSLRYSADTTVVSRFVDEARAVNRIGHPGIVDIFAFGQLPDGRHYHVMELLEGETLSDRLRRRDRLPLAEALPIFTALASALDAAHHAGIAHRDVKPANVFLFQKQGAEGTKLLDFGLAKLFGDPISGRKRT
ncbi:MAG: serine/threonine protein kinase, partial [Myxococcales bacterium]|nr:serine/threonine protein kinase [Myxococcales bacterium]